MNFKFELNPQNLVRVAVAGAIGLAVLQVLGPFRAGSAWRHGLYDGVALLGGGALLVFGFMRLRRKRLIENMPTSRIRSAAMGFVELEGLARPKTSVPAPFSGIPCVYFRFQVEVEKSRNRRGRTWETIERGDSGVPFHLQDTTGTILVDPAGAEIMLRQSFRKIERGEGFFGRRTRYTEWWIVTGQRIFVAGTVRRVRDLAQERRVTLHDRLRDLKSDPQRMSALDTDRDGQISTEEWGNAVRAVQDEVVRDAASAPEAAPPEDDVLIGKGSDETTFLIADRSEKWLVGRMALQSAAALAGGAVLVVVFSVSLLARAGVLPGGWIVGW